MREDDAYKEGSNLEMKMNWQFADELRYNVAAQYLKSHHMHIQTHDRNIKMKFFNKQNITQFLY